MLARCGDGRGLGDWALQSTSAWDSSRVRIFQVRDLPLRWTNRLVGAPRTAPVPASVKESIGTAPQRVVKRFARISHHCLPLTLTEESERAPAAETIWVSSISKTVTLPTTPDDRNDGPGGVTRSGMAGRCVLVQADWKNWPRSLCDRVEGPSDRQ
jgi:hypothetical protein